MKTTSGAFGLLKPVATISLALLIAIGGAGCASLNLREEPIAKDSASEFFQQLRKPSPDDRVWSFSEKARQIERDLGFH